jgi:GT2 family glycosyltransferase
MVSMGVDVSVVIVNWNTRDLLLDCIESLITQTQHSTLEVIVVDNGSHDGSADALARAFPEVRILRNSENLGFARACNQGLTIATGDYLCLVNSDVKALDGVIDQMRDYLQAHPEIGALAPRTVGRDMQLRRNCRDDPTLRNEASQLLFLNRLFPRVQAFRGRTLQDYDYATPRDIEVLSGCFLMVPRKVWEDVGGLDERFFIYAEDADWSKRIRDAGWRVVCYPQAQAVHYGGSSASVEPVTFTVELMKANLQFWRKHHGRVKTGIYWLLLLVGSALRVVVWSARWALSRSDRPGSLRQAQLNWHGLRWLITSSYRFAGVAQRPIEERTLQ